MTPAKYVRAVYPAAIREPGPNGFQVRDKPGGRVLAESRFPSGAWREACVAVDRELGR